MGINCDIDHHFRNSELHLLTFGRNQGIASTMLYPNNLSLLSLLTSFAFSALTLAQDASETVIRNPLTETTTADAQDDEFAGTTAPPENPVAEGTIGNRNGSPGGDSKAGARGPDDGSFSLSKGGMIAVIVVVVIVVLVGSKSQGSPFPFSRAVSIRHV